MGLDFVALDFETACEKMCSICAVGYAKVRDGIVVETGDALIDPECKFSFWNTQVHGITEDDVAGAPTFRKFWPELKTILGNDVIVCHNASFDINAMREALSEFGETFSNSYACTLRLSRRLMPGLPSYRLNALCDLLDIPLDHHNAASDAAACARIAIHMAQQHRAADMRDLAKIAGDCAFEKHAPYRQREKTDAIDWAQYTSEPIFKGRNVVFTGELDAMERDVAVKIVTQLGGTVKACVTRKTNILVVGIQTSKWIVGQYSSKHLKALDLIEAGHNISIIDESCFLEWLRQGIIQGSEASL